LYFFSIVSLGLFFEIVRMLHFFEGFKGYGSI